jgi:hypothetical protein
VEALELEGRNIVLKITIIHADEDSFRLEPNCVLQMLWDAGGSWEPSKIPLHAEVSLDHILDPTWLLANTSRFIVSVEPIADDKQSSLLRHDALGASSSSGQPSSAAKVVVTEARWLAHIKPSQSWDSAPFDARGYV